MEIATLQEERIVRIRKSLSEHIWLFFVMLIAVNVIASTKAKINGRYYCDGTFFVGRCTLQKKSNEIGILQAQVLKRKGSRFIIFIKRHSTLTYTQLVDVY